MKKNKAEQGNKRVKVGVSYSRQGDQERPLWYGVIWGET